MAAIINELRAKIRDIRQRNYDDRLFVPQDDLYRLLTPQVVSLTLENSGVDKSRLSDLALSVHQGARKVFAVLVILREIQHILDFVGHDQFRDLDQQLPFDQDDMKKMAIQGSITRDFYEEQWQFLAPVFSRRLLPRELADNTPLPITERVRIGSGGFGTAYKIKIHTSHHNLGTSVEGYFVQKSFSVDNEMRKDYESEAYNLTILSHLRHSYILELLSAFTHRNTHHLIFPWVPGGDLATLLQGSVSEFRSHEEWLIALCHLASAIGRVHNFTANPTLDLELIGCHHDLKPRNILVEGTMFRLADFGISKFRSASESSATRHKIGQGDYLAPECKELNGDFAEGIIGRSSDIWSFGCIIAEILSYILKGADGVRRFRDSRRHQLGNTVFFLFHHGPGAPSAAVVDWISKLENDPQAIPMLVPLIKQMLSVEPTSRPKAAEVQARLQMTVLRLIANKIVRKYKATCANNVPVNAWIERWRFESWSHACRIMRTIETSDMIHVDRFDYDFQATLDILYRIQEHLDSIESAGLEVRERAFFPLRHLNNDLAELLSPKAQNEMQDELERHVLNIRNMERLGDNEQVLHTQVLGEHPAQLVAIKRMTILAEQHPSPTQPSLQINPGKICYVQKLHSGDIAIINETEGDVSSPVLVEWVQHEVHVTEQMGHDRLRHINALATLLNMENKPEEFRVLHCRSYFHDVDKPQFGMVFDLPVAPAAAGEPPTLRPLADIFVPRNKRGLRPTLGDKFKLATALATSIAEFHKVGWLHKNISSANVVFFPPPGISPEKHITRPYIIGFSHSRPTLGFTEGSFDPRYIDYQHPEYLRNELRFKFKFDYYSLGLVLLEIGYWEPLQDIKGGWNCSSEGFRDRLLTKRVPRLKETMGHIYFNVVDVCLRSAFMVSEGGGDEDDNAASLHVKYQELVVTQLAKCSA